MYIMTHGENEKDTIDGGLTSRGKDQVAKAIKEIKEAQNPDIVRNHYFADVVTSDLKCCIETAEIAADILNIDIEKTPFHESVPQYCSKEDFKVRVVVSMLLRGHKPNESEKEFYERVRVLLNNKTIDNIGNIYYNLNKVSIPSPLLLHDDNYWRTHLLVTDQSMINAIYRYYGSYNPELVKLAEKQYFAQQYASLYKIKQSCEEYSAKEQGKTRTMHLHTGFIRKCDHTDF